MRIFEILKYPNPFLQKKCREVPKEKINADLRRTIASMFDTMYHYKGCGLAANQVGLDYKLFVMDMFEEKNKKIVAINPKIIQKKEEIFEEEACLSLPGVFSKIKRFKYIEIEALNEVGIKYTLKCKERSSICVQHEIDHLDGIIYLDYLSKLKRNLIEKKYSKRLKRYKT